MTALPGVKAAPQPQEGKYKKTSCNVMSMYYNWCS